MTDPVQIQSKLTEVFWKTPIPSALRTLPTSSKRWNRICEIPHRQGVEKGDSGTDQKNSEDALDGIWYGMSHVSQRQQLCIYMETMFNN